MSTLSGANTYTGVTVVNGGTLEIGSAAQSAAFNLGGVSAGHGVLVFDYNAGVDPLSTINTAIANGKISHSVAPAPTTSGSRSTTAPHRRSPSPTPSRATPTSTSSATEPT